MNINIKKLHPNAQIPTYANAGDACFDLYAATVAGKQYIGQIVYEGAPLVCGTGLAFEIPEGQVMLIFSRSGHAFHHDIRLANCTGIIDAGFTGEVMVKLTCDAPDDDDVLPPYKVNPGDRIAQALVIPVERVAFTVVDELSETARGTGGLGSSGA
jgi:dUTP pyrophosphatase